jgi:dTDP-4-amino-4,6-dideoxygalactose transaminase
LEDIPLLDLQSELRSLRAELQQAFDDVIDGGAFILGPNVKQFEAEAAAYLGARHAIGVNSGTDAIVLSLRAAGVGPGDEVVTTPFTFFATAESISMLGATPVFVDIDPVSFNIDLDQAEAAVTPKTKAIVPVHLFGNPVDMDRVNALGLVAVEDTAQAFGAEWKGKRVGTHATAGAFSFFPSKNLGGLGDGGLVTTDDDAIAEQVRMLRAHGGKQKYRNEMLGYNSRLDELQAAFLRVKLRHIDAANEGRRRVAAHYSALLDDVAGVDAPTEASGGRHVYHQYTVRIGGGRRDAVADALSGAGIGNAVYYPVPVHRLPVYEGTPQPTLPVAEAAAAEVLSLPIWPTMPDDAIERVVAALEAVG